MKTKRKKGPQAPGSVDYSALADFVEHFLAKKVVLFGDFVADEFRFGEIARVSREAPVLILQHRKTQLVPGGGANAANNLADLGARVLPVTAVGDDAAGDTLIQYFRAKRVDVSGILRVRGWTTPVKTRFLAGWPHTKPQQVLRVDRAPQAGMPEEARKQLAGKLRDRLRAADALAVSDYGFGVTRADAVSDAVRKSKRELMSTLDARYGLREYAGAGITAATPNEAELESLHGTKIGKNQEELERCGWETLRSLKLRSLLVTRGRDGMTLFEEGKQPAYVAIHGSDEALDVTGAGDTVLAAFTLALASGASALEAAHLANIAAGLVVMKAGTATVSRQELQAAIRREITGA